MSLDQVFVHAGPKATAKSSAADLDGLIEWRVFAVVSET
jgi:hypothetical protein